VALFDCSGCLIGLSMKVSRLGVVWVGNLVGNSDVLRNSDVWFGNVTALEVLHVTGKYRDRSMAHTCSRHAAWDPHRLGCGVWGVRCRFGLVLGSRVCSLGFTA